MNGDDFEAKWHRKIVRPKRVIYKQLNDKEYFVTSAYPQNSETIFAIKALDYSLENKDWVSIHLTIEEAINLESEFEIIRDGWEECKPFIVNEILWSFTDHEDKWRAQFSSYTFEDQCGREEIEKSQMQRTPAPEEYMFLYHFKGGEQIETKPLCYIIPIPDFEYRSEVEEYVKDFREDVLAGRVIMGFNRRTQFVQK